jgi:membrane protein insertase Oxa1/YidC/SpoIIIJ
MTFSVIDSSGKVIWTGQDSITVQTEALFTKSFPGLKNLSAGKYTLKLHTVYNGTVTDDFMSSFSIVESAAWYTQASNWLFSLFGISKTTGQALLSNWWWLILAIVLIILFILWFIVWKRRHKKDEEEGLKKANRRHF